jgi:hypothetical protein
VTDWLRTKSRRLSVGCSSAVKEKKKTSRVKTPRRVTWRGRHSTRNTLGFLHLVVQANNLEASTLHTVTTDAKRVVEKVH